MIVVLCPHNNLQIALSIVTLFKVRELIKNSHFHFTIIFINTVLPPKSPKIQSGGGIAQDHPSFVFDWRLQCSGRPGWLLVIGFGAQS